MQFQNQNVPLRTAASPVGAVCDFHSIRCVQTVIANGICFIGLVGLST